MSGASIIAHRRSRRPFALRSPSTALARARARARRRHGNPYHYHLPPSCLLKDLGDDEDGASPQVAWMYDGFPLMGPKGPGGVEMLPCGAERAHATLCADACGGLHGDLGDGFLYRYYAMGELSDGVSNPLTPLPGEEYMPHTPLCLVGCVPSGATFEFDTRFPNLAMPDCPADSASAVTTTYVATALETLAHVVTSDRTVDVCMSKAGFAGSSAAALVACDGSADCYCSEVDDDEVTTAPPTVTPVPVATDDDDNDDDDDDILYTLGITVTMPGIDCDDFGDDEAHIFRSAVAATLGTSLERVGEPSCAMDMHAAAAAMSYEYDDDAAVAAMSYAYDGDDDFASRRRAQASSRPDAAQASSRPDAARRLDHAAEIEFEVGIDADAAEYLGYDADDFTVEGAVESVEETLGSFLEDEIASELPGDYEGALTSATITATRADAMEEEEDDDDDDDDDDDAAAHQTPQSSKRAASSGDDNGAVVGAVLGALFGLGACGAVGYAVMKREDLGLATGSEPKTKRTPWHENFKSSRMFDAKTDPLHDLPVAGAGDWEVVKDDATGTPYWWNVKTNKTTWEQPPGAPDAALV